MTDAGDMRPKLADFVRLQPDQRRGGHVLQGPERVLVLDDTAAAVLRLCDGTRSLRQIGEVLAERYDAPAEAITADAADLVRMLADKGLLSDGRG